MAVLRSVPTGNSTKAPALGPAQQLRPASVLPAGLGYDVPANELDCENCDNALVGIEFVQGDSTGMQFRIETSDDLAAWFFEPDVDEVTMTLRVMEVNVATTMNVDFPVGLKRRYARVSARALTSAVNTSLRITGKGLSDSRTN